MATDIQKPTAEEAASWYDKNRQLYDAYAQCIRSLLETLIKASPLPYHSITFRVKERDSFLKKFRQKSYASCEEITDVAGIRVIAYTTADVKRICSLIEEEFRCDPENSVDKSREMQENQVGYLSVHYIASLNQGRESWREYARYKGLKCEIQVRTLLQHAWAEIEHDRNYKFGGVLPKEIRRRFYLVAGTLELMDREFQTLSDDIDAYAQQVTEHTVQGSLNIPIDSISLAQYMRQKFPNIEDGYIPLERNFDVIEELHDMGIQNLDQLDKLLASQSIEDVLSQYPHLTTVGILRHTMIVHDYKRYFDVAWKYHWIGLDEEVLRLWAKLGVDTNDLKARMQKQRKQSK